jgi:chitinase
MKLKRKLTALLTAAAIAVSSAVFPLSANASEDDNAKKLNVYYINWAATNSLHNNQQVKDLPWDRISTINHAFWKIQPNESHTEFPIVTSDASADFGDDGKGGAFAQYAEYIKKYPNVKVVLSVGGWNDTRWFAEMASTAAGRKSFNDSCLDTLKKYPWLGGIDIDWEYPGTARNAEGEGFVGSAADKGNFTALLKEMRGLFDKNGLSDKIITFCASTNTVKLKSGEIAVDFAAVDDYVDRINVMTYDMSTSGTMEGLHHAALYPSDYVREGYSASEAAEYLLSLGVKASKINIGSPLYSQGWVIPADDDEPLGKKASKSGYGTIGGGQLYWFDLKKMENTDGWIAGYDDVAEAAWLYNNDPTSTLYQQFYTYENEQSLQAKLDYIEEKGLGGLIVWDTPGDSIEADYPMLTQMAVGLGIYDGEIPTYDAPAYIPPEIPKANPLGIWSDDIQWNAGDVTIWEGKVLKALATTHVAGGETPVETAGVAWGYWAILGDEADLGALIADGTIEVPEWNDDTVWRKGAIVAHNDGYYQALANTHLNGGEKPESPGGIDWGYWTAYTVAAAAAGAGDTAAAGDGKGGADTGAADVTAVVGFAIVAFAAFAVARKRK